MATWGYASPSNDPRSSITGSRHSKAKMGSLIVGWNAEEEFRDKSFVPDMLPSLYSIWGRKNYGNGNDYARPLCIRISVKGACTKKLYLAEPNDLDMEEIREEDLLNLKEEAGEWLSEAANGGSAKLAFVKEYLGQIGFYPRSRSGCRGKGP